MSSIDLETIARAQARLNVAKSQAAPYAEITLAAMRSWGREPTDSDRRDRVIEYVRNTPPIDSTPISVLSRFGTEGGALAAAAPDNASEITCWLLALEAS